MSEKEGIESVNKTEKAEKTANKAFEETLTPGADQFQSIMETEKVVAPEQYQKVEGKWVAQSAEEAAFHKQTQSAERVTPVDSTNMVENISELRANVKETALLTPADIQSRSKELVTRLEGLKKELEATKGTLKPSYHKVLEHRLTHIDDSLKVALSKVGGGDFAAAEAKPRAAGGSPVEKFIDMLTDSQRQLENLDSSMTHLSESGKSLDHSSMLALQVKVGMIQHQIELFANLLSKALESTKQIMSVQI